MTPSWRDDDLRECAYRLGDRPSFLSASMRIAARSGLESLTETKSVESKKEKDREREGQRRRGIRIGIDRRKTSSVERESKV